MPFFDGKDAHFVAAVMSELHVEYFAPVGG
jgi:hypothetical protein